MNFVALDFETANEKRNSACALGLTVIRDGAVEKSIYQLIRPRELRFSHWNVKVHGITAEDVIDAPTLDSFWPEIAGLFETQLIVAHNTSFDISVLRHSLHACSIPIPRLSYLCTLQLSRQIWPQLISHKLNYLAMFHGISLDHHHAGSDSYAAASLLLRALQENNHVCPRKLAVKFNLTIGEIFSDQNWTPSSAPRSRPNSTKIELEIPVDFDSTVHPLNGKNVVFTGKLETFERESAQQIVKQFGGTAKTSVSS